MLFRSNDTATTEIYTCLDTLSLHDALPISVFEQVRRERVAKPVKRDPSMDLGPSTGQSEPMTEPRCADRCVGPRAVPAPVHREEPRTGQSVETPMISKRLQQPFTEHHHARLVTLSVTHVNQLVRAVDVGGLK